MSTKSNNFIFVCLFTMWYKLNIVLPPTRFLTSVFFETFRRDIRQCVLLGIGITRIQIFFLMFWIFICGGGGL